MAFEITGEPALHSVTPGAEITYRCKRPYAVMESMEAYYGRRFQFYCHNDESTAKQYGAPFIVRGPSRGIWEKAKWEFPGKHGIQCCVIHVTGRKEWPWYTQWVESMEALLSRLLEEQKRTGLPHPTLELSTVTRMIDLLENPTQMAASLRDASKKYEFPDGDVKRAHEKRLEGLRKYKEKLGERLESTHHRRRIPIAAVHVAAAEQRKSKLRVFVACVRDDGPYREEKEFITIGGGTRTITHKSGGQTWAVVDWTNPTVRELTGVYEGSGRDAKEAILAAISAWDSGNRYIDGKLEWEVPKAACGEVLSNSFETDGASFWDSIAAWLEYIALGAAVVAGVVTLVAPVPGSRVVSGLIWTSIFSSTTAAVINIGQRYDEGFSNWKEDGLDALTIVGNIFTAGWMRCANLKTFVGTERKIAQVALIGQVSTDAVQGVVLSVDIATQIEKAVEDPNLTPEERQQKVLELIRSALISGILLYVSLKGTKADLDHLNAGKIDRSLLDRMKDPDEVVDLTKPPKVKGDTADGEVKTKLQDEPIRPGDLTPRPRQEFAPSKTPADRGMRDLDDKVFGKLAKDEDVIIIVRNSNPDAAEYIGKPGYKAKTEKVKAKSRKKPPNKGLAAADPTDEALQKYIKENNLTYEEYLEKLKGEGFTVGPKKEGYLVRDAEGNLFYSDYDLHGVYHTTGESAYSEGLRKKMNARMGVDNVQHGPHDEWPDRNKPSAGPNRGPQGDSTAYLPDGTSVNLKTIEDMKRFYKAYGIDWDRIYPGY